MTESCWESIDDNELELMMKVQAHVSTVGKDSVAGDLDFVLSNITDLGL